MDELNNLYTIGEDGNVIYREGLTGSWLALAQEHYLSSQQEKESSN